MENIAVLRQIIETAKPRNYNPGMQPREPREPLRRGWLLPYLFAADQFTWKRWDHWAELMMAGHLIDKPIPQIEWCIHGNRPGRKMLEVSLDHITQHGGWQGWGSWAYFEYFMAWLLFGFGHPTIKALPQEPSGAEGASNRLYQVFNLETLLAYPYDYFGDILAENSYGRHRGFYPTPLDVVELITRMTFESTMTRTATVHDPCLGTGRMLLVASNFSYRLYGCDVDSTVLKAALVNGYLYAPWLVKPFSFLETNDLAPRQAGPRQLTVKVDHQMNGDPQPKPKKSRRRK